MEEAWSGANLVCICFSQEYEKRLLAKDHDLKCLQAQLEHVRIELAEAKRIQAEGSHLLPAPEAHEGACLRLPEPRAMQT